jgi:DNA-binding transcriptional LysR family regulator
MLHEIDLSRVDLNLFVLFEAVLRERHVGRAAQRLNLSPSAVSHGLGRLRLLLKDPVFLRTPKGVTPTARALELASQIDDLLSQARGVLATAVPFDPATSQREFTIGAPDGVANLYLLPLFAKLRRDAPGVNVRMRQVLPAAGRAIEQAWDAAFTDLDARALDLAIGPFTAVPNRFEVAELGIESFVIISRSGHPFAKRPGLDAYCQADHLVVSQSGDAHGFVDVALAELGRSRRVALTVPAFAMALPIVAETDLLSAVPRSFAETLGSAAGVTLVEPPMSLPRFTMRSVVPKSGLTDSGLAWMRSAITATSASNPACRR